MSLPRSLLIAVIASAVLAACKTDGIMDFFEEARPWPNERRVLARDWVVPGRRAEEKPIYCYRTLGSVECYPEPIAGQEHRRVEDFSPMTPRRRR
ncbi:MAG: hypothetical protein OEQ29_23005 [Alphaproteobacteria bacterium]|nr:hypothetical protein [Alphaproteobacteria bacterium]